MAFVELQKHHCAKAPGTESLRSSACATVYGQWSTLDRQEMNRDAHAWAECVGLCGSRKITDKQSMVNGPWPMVHAEQLMVNG